MIKFTQSMVNFYAKNGIELPIEMTHTEFQDFLAVHRL